MSKSTDRSRAHGFQFQNLARDTVVAIAIRIAGFVLTYLLQIGLARWLGETQYGIYAYVYSLTFLLSIFACFGWPHTVLRFVAEYQVMQAWGLLRGILRVSWLLSCGIAIGITIVGMGGIWELNHYFPFVYATPLTLGMWLVPLFALVLLQKEMARALGDILLAYAPYYVVLPLCVILATWIASQQENTVSGMMEISINIGVLVVVVVGQLCFIGARLNQTVEPANPEYAIREWLPIAVVLSLMTAFGIILQQTDIIMVGALIGPEQAGLYDVAAKTSLWVGFVLQTVNMVAAPEFARLYKRDDREGLQRAISAISLWIFWPSVIIASIEMIFTPQILSLFGSEFTQARWVLAILIVGQVVNALCGSVGFLMIMTGHQNPTLVVYGTAAAVNVVLNSIGIPWLGAIGAATATTVTMILWNVWLSVLVFKYVNVNSLVFSGFDRKNWSLD